MKFKKFLQFYFKKTFQFLFKLILVAAFFHTTLYAEEVKVFKFTDKELQELDDLTLLRYASKFLPE